MSLEDDFHPLSFSSSRDNRFDFAKHKTKLTSARDKVDAATTNIFINEKFQDRKINKPGQMVPDGTHGIGFKLDVLPRRKKVSLQYDDGSDDDTAVVKRVRLDDFSNRVNFVRKNSERSKSLYKPFVKISEPLQVVKSRIPCITQELKRQSESEMLKIDKVTASQMIEESFKPLSSTSDNMDYVLYLHSVCADSDFEMSPHQREVFSNANLTYRMRASQYLKSKFVPQGEVVNLAVSKQAKREIRKIDVSHIVLKRLGIKKEE